MRVLSIDWDYLVEATMHERIEMFPDGNDDLDYSISDYIWSSHYHDPRLSEVKINDLYYKKLKEFVSKFEHKICFAESHKSIYYSLEVMLERNSFENLAIVNVDFHHDMYHFGGDKLNCGNWARLIKEKYPERIEYTWVGREDSETELITGDIVELSSLSFEEVLEREYDFLFICRSDAWSPPHLDHLFKELIKVATHTSSKMYDSRVDDCRAVYLIPEITFNQVGDESE